MFLKILPKGAVLLLFMGFSTAIYAQQNNSGRTTERRSGNSENQTVQSKSPNTQVQMHKSESGSSERELVLAQQIVGYTSRIYASDDSEVKSKLQLLIDGLSVVVPYRGNGQYSSLRDLHTWVVKNTELAKDFTTNLKMLHLSTIK